MAITGGAWLATNGADKIQELLKRRNDLLPRLQKGRERIRLEDERGSERADYFLEFWLALLTDYEQTVDQLRTLGVDEAQITDEPGRETSSR
ncbi:MAG: hypothetical protein ACYC5O_09230 [Anaerolineae bacterium]